MQLTPPKNIIGIFVHHISLSLLCLVQVWTLLRFFFFFGQVYKWSIAPKVRNHNVVQATIIWPILGNMVHMFGTRWKNKHIYHIYRSILPCIGYLHNHKTKVKSSRFNFITEIGLLSHWNFNLSIYIINTIIYFNIDNIIYFSFEMTKKYLYFFHTLL